MDQYISSLSPKYIDYPLLEGSNQTLQPRMKKNMGDN